MIPGQFGLDIFSELGRLGFDSYLVRGIGIMDRGFVWALQEAAYTQRDIRRIVAYQKELMVSVDKRNAEKDAHKMTLAEAAWERREKWNGYYIVKHRSQFGLRGALSLIMALEIRHPTPIILCESQQKIIYVQESPDAVHLFETFGGFTFGMDHNWGYKNEPGKREVGLREVKKVLKG